MELWDIYNKSGQLTGRTHRRGEPLPDGDYHLVVHIWILNDKKEWLVQKRAEHLKHLPSIWCNTGGSALAGESSVCAAQRELSEELGINLHLSKFKLVKRLIRKDSFADIWLVNYNIDQSMISFDPQEVAAVNWLSNNEIKRMICNKEFHDYGEEYYKLIFDSI